jgi:uncharacterized membrane protein YeaQ/YmgE (transglycosylase-associated protein family)
MTSMIINSLVGAAGGWLTAQLGKGNGFGMIGNLVSGLVGGNLGAAIPGLLGMAATATATGETNMTQMAISGIASLVGGGGATFLSSLIKKPD